MLLEDYDLILSFFYNRALKWAYEPNDNPLPVQQIECILVDHKLLDKESFFGTFHLWCYVSRKMTLPILYLERTIPCTILQWNTINKWGV
jgi:hypothetical protein